MTFKLSQQVACLQFLQSFSLPIKYHNCKCSQAARFIAGAATVQRSGQQHGCPLATIATSALTLFLGSLQLQEEAEPQQPGRLRHSGSSHSMVSAGSVHTPRHGRQPSVGKAAHSGSGDKVMLPGGAAGEAEEPSDSVVGDLRGGDPEAEVQV